jgi:hypothetical protein
MGSVVGRRCFGCGVGTYEWNQGLQGEQDGVVGCSYGCGSTVLWQQPLHVLRGAYRDEPGHAPELGVAPPVSRATRVGSR